MHSHPLSFLLANHRGQGGGFGLFLIPLRLLVLIRVKVRLLPGRLEDFGLTRELHGGAEAEEAPELHI